MKQLIQLMKFIIVVFLVTTLTLVDVGQAAISSPNAPVGDNLGPVTSRDTIYQIVTDRFVDGNSNNNVPEGFDPTLFDGTGEDLKLYQGGDFAGIVEKIPYLKEMGITAVWISAPYSNRDTEILDYQSDGSIDRWTSFHAITPEISLKRISILDL
ncbi:alpha-amylase family glycosyl hydrolase [Geomicrobium sp. JCM 19039]|uniref:alpha-amylase family glycosyl hydrolase n=1 Tax=Geomicrobium sp. JCM 19039 TaxID=1460636 RepID=UPI00045F1E52|nr:alpha-amylase family glycosyl hydrolase [Geomicrobium sp. JCM 19039]GAK10528.1 cyclomaltodextrin glucanotransferase [Geomicrobium sp. JCM 19039]